MGDQNNHDRSNCEQCLRDDLETANERIAELERELAAIKGQEPVAWKYEVDASFNGKEWVREYKVSLDENVARFKCVGDLTPLYARPVAPTPSIDHLREFAESLAAEQEPLPADFQKVLHDHRWELYEPGLKCGGISHTPVADKDAEWWRELLISCRGSVQFDLNNYERVMSEMERTDQQITDAYAAVSDERTRLARLLNTIDAAMAKGE